MKEARQAWPQKAIWINFPSPIHLSPRDEIRAMTETIITEAGNDEKFLIGITEDPPIDRAMGNYLAIMDEIDSMAVKR